MRFSMSAVVGLGFFVSGCQGLPASGPGLGSVTNSAAGVVVAPTKFPYELVSLSPDTAAVSNRGGSVVLSQVFRDRRAFAEIKLGIGDVVGVTIFEASSGGLFIPADAGSRAGNFVTLPTQTVDRAGNISVPYAGAIRAAGRTPAQVQNDVARKLSERAIDPQVVVTVAEQRSQLVSVLGEVNAPLRTPVTASGERLLDSIARAGGIRGNGVDLWLRLVRDGKERQIHFPDMTRDPRNNIYTLPNDTIYLYRDPPTYLAFGASGSQGQFGFDAERLTLSEAVAKAGGLLDDRAEPTSVFLYRIESGETAAAFGIDTSKYAGKHAGTGTKSAGTQVPVIYSLNLREPQGFFTASQLEMRNKDVIFVSNAATIELSKFLQILRIGVASVREGNAGVLEVR